METMPVLKTQDEVGRTVCRDGGKYVYPCSGRDRNYGSVSDPESLSPEPVFLNVYGAQESILRNEPALIQIQRFRLNTHPD